MGAQYSRTYRGTENAERIETIAPQVTVSNEYGVFADSVRQPWNSESDGVERNIRPSFWVFTSASSRAGAQDMSYSIRKWF